MFLFESSQRLKIIDVGPTASWMAATYTAESRTCPHAKFALEPSSENVARHKASLPLLQVVETHLNPKPKIL